MLGRATEVNKAETDKTLKPGEEALKNIEQDVKKQQNGPEQSQADSLYKQYNKSREESDKSEQEAASKQDVGLWNNAASKRKIAMDKFRAWQLAQLKAGGGSAGNSAVRPNIMPPEMAT